MALSGTTPLFDFDLNHKKIHHFLKNKSFIAIRSQTNNICGQREAQKEPTVHIKQRKDLKECQETTSLIREAPTLLMRGKKNPKQEK